MKKKKQKGYIALTTVLIILPLLLLTGIDSVYKNITLLLTGKMTYDHNILEINAETCLEESVYKIKKNRTYAGVLTITQTEWSCTATISDKSGEAGVKLIEITASDKGDNVVTIFKQLNTNTDPFGISNI